MNKKCLGCGATLQCTIEENEGYVEEKKYPTAEICKRCFRIKYYGDYKFVDKTNKDFVKILKNISKTGDLVLYLVDLFSVDRDIEEIYKYLSNPIVLVVTKKDILPKDVSDKKILEYFNGQGLKVEDSIVISSKKNYNFDRLYQIIRMYKKTNTVYVVGNTNVGKSTFVNRCITNFGDKNASITTSILPSTTLDCLEVKISDYLTLIDTPGFLSTNNYINKASYKDLKKIIPRKLIKPVVYQLKNNASLLIDEYARIDLIFDQTTDSHDFITYMSSDLSITRANIVTNNSLKDYTCHEFKVKPKEDVVINGLGWIKCTSKATLKIYVPNDIDVYRRNSVI